MDSRTGCASTTSTSATAPRITAVVSELADLEVLVNNAGYGLIGGVEQTDLAQVREKLRDRTCSEPWR